MQQEISQLKQELRKQIGDLDQVWHTVLEAVQDEVAWIQATQQKADSVIPQIDFQRVKQGIVSNQEKEALKRCGCAIIQNVFPRSQATQWYEDARAYLEENNYYTQEVPEGLDHYFGELGASKPQIFNIFWSKTQILARQHENMQKTCAFLNSFWNANDEHGNPLFLPEYQTVYADRIRMREPGDKTLGLSPHIDSGSVERWLDVNYREKTYQQIFDGNWESYNPFNVGGRLEVKEIPSPAVCRSFRSFQGWTALTQQGPNDGTLQLVPMINPLIAYTLLRPLLSDVPDDLLCGSQPKRAHATTQEWHHHLLQGLVHIPEVNPGDTVWWHPDMIHAVANEHCGNEYSSVIYIGATPLCIKNAHFLKEQKEAFLTGKSSPDFAAEHREVDYKNRGTLEDLTDEGKRQLGLLAWNLLETESLDSPKNQLLAESRKILNL